MEHLNLEDDYKSEYLIHNEFGLIGIGEFGKNILLKINDVKTLQLTTENSLFIHRTEIINETNIDSILYNKLSPNSYDKFYNKSIVFIFAGLGGIIGSEAIFKLLNNFKQKDIVTISFVTLPFEFEADEKIEKALKLIKLLPQYSTTTVVIPNKDIPYNTGNTQNDRINYINELIVDQFSSIISLITAPGEINIDLADVIAVFRSGYYSHIGTGSSFGDNRAIAAAKIALNNFPINKYLQFSSTVLINVSGGNDFTLDDYQNAIQLITENMKENALLIPRATSNEKSGNVKVTIIISGLKINYDFFYTDIVKKNLPIQNTKNYLPVPSLIVDSLHKISEDIKMYSASAFIIMNFSNTKFHNTIYNTIKETLSKYNIAAFRADEKEYHSDLYYNILTYLHGCDFAIAVFDRINTNNHNPNVALEVGYTLALNKEICLLKEKTLEKLPTDIVNKIYVEFDLNDIEQTLSNSIEKWLVRKEIIAI